MVFWYFFWKGFPHIGQHLFTASPKLPEVLLRLCQDHAVVLVAWLCCRLYEHIIFPKTDGTDIRYRFFLRYRQCQISTAGADNKVLFDFFTTGTYDRNREFILTTSPSMDILISSNLERLIYRIAGNDPEKNKVLMEELTKDGVYHITDEMKMQLADFYGNYATEEETAETIRKIYKDCGYVIDTHTSVAATVYKKYTEETGDTAKTVIASTASPYKFTRSVMEAIDEEKYAAMGDFELIDQLSEISGVAVPNAIEEIRNAKVRHNTVADVAEMPVVVKKILGIQ